MNHLTFFAMGCEIQVWGESADLTPVAALFESAEQRFSRFRPDSELSQLNNQPDRWVSVSPEMWELLHKSLALADATGGLFNPTLLTLLEQAGYDRTFSAIGQQRKPARFANSDLVVPHYSDIQFDPVKRAIWLPNGLRLDFGGIAKAETAQQAVTWLRQFGASLVDASGDLVAGDAPNGDPGWPVGVSAPFGAGENLLRLWLANRTLATSGVDRRRWHAEAGQKHHIIDPRSGDSAETDLLSVSIWSNDAGSADAYATAALILGRDAAFAFLTERMIPAALVDQRGQLLLTPALRPFVQIEPNAVVFEMPHDLRSI
jgi:thiamine biosynthesis lipoprotein